MQKNKKLLIIDDTPINLKRAQKAVEGLEKEDILKNYIVDYCGNFDEALKKVKEEKYDEVITDLFEGEITPKGLLVALECLDRRIKVGILTEGNRHHDALGTLRYYLQGGDPNKYDCYSDSDYEARKLGITPEDMKKRNVSFYWDLLIGHDGVDKKTVAIWKESIKTFLKESEIPEPKIVG